MDGSSSSSASTSTSPTNEERNPVSSAIAAAAGATGLRKKEEITVTSGTQTRFRFYEPQEAVDENKEEKNAHRFNFYDDKTRQELAAVENNMRAAQKKKVTTPTPIVLAPPTTNITAASATADPLGSADEILKSLQETEEQRLSILQVSDPNAQSVPAAPPSNDDSANNNPYEDAIKEALDLLRKHRSPPTTPSAAVDATPLPTSLEVNSTSSPDLLTNGPGRARTPREEDRLLKHRVHNGDDTKNNKTLLATTSGGDSGFEVETSNTGETNNSEETNSSTPLAVDGLTDAYEEHKLKAKQRQQRMAQYASRLQEFKSSLPSETVDQHWPPSLANNHSNVESFVRGEPGTPQDVASIPHVTSQAEDSVGFSDISHSTKEQVEAEVQRGVERVLLAILERANSSRGRASPNNSESGRASKQTYDGASQTENSSSVAGISMNDALIRAMDDLGLGNVSTAASGDLSSTGDLRTKTSIETEGTGFASKKSATSVVDELLAEDDMDEEEEDEDDTDENDKTSQFSMTSPGASITAHYGPSWGDEKKLPDSQEKGNKSQDDSFQEDDVDRLVDECLRDPSTDQLDADTSDYEGEGSNTDSPQMRGVLGPLSKKAGTTGVVLDIEQEEEASNESPSEQDFGGALTSVMKYVSSAISPDDTTEKEPPSQRGQDPPKKEAEDVEATELMRTLCAHLLPFGVDQQSNRLLEAIPDWDESNPNEAGYRIIRLSKSQLRRVERAFDTMINGLKQTSELQLNGLESGDAKFARELQEAERLLDESEEDQLRQAQLSKKEPRPADVPKTEVSTAVKETFTVEDGDCHPNFPGVKLTGKGEMGDLEYFHLPIIFKSHVTGFEPTKDLVLEPGNVVAGQYLVESELGSAAFSTAYRCIDLSSENLDGHEEVCLKVIKNTKDFFDQSLDEIKILELLRQTGQVQDNHIVEMKCFFYYREHLVIVTELLRQNLFEFGKFITDNNEEPYFTVPRLAYITRQALIALRFVHKLGLVHSDVKPENILLGSYSRAQIKLIDFGSSCYLTDRQSSYIQSRSYRAPEVVLGLPYDGRIDVWSLGCVVAEMYTGEVTFQNDSIVSMLSRIEAISGHFPRHMIAQGRQSGRFFTRSGLLYEVVGDSERGDNGKVAPGPYDDEDDMDDVLQFDIFQPKNTYLSARLGFDTDLMDDYSESSNRKKPRDHETYEEQMFTDFIRKLLTIDADARPTADEALQHPWMKYAATLTEEDVKYPSS